MLLVFASLSLAQPSGFTRFPGQHIQGHDDAGVFVLDHEHSTVNVRVASSSPSPHFFLNFILRGILHTHTARLIHLGQ